jgi:hypothetical protein
MIIKKDESLYKDFYCDSKGEVLLIINGADTASKEIEIWCRRFPENIVYSLCPNSDGYLWIKTQLHNNSLNVSFPEQHEIPKMIRMLLLTGAT